MNLIGEHTVEVHSKRIGAKRGRPINEKTNDAQEMKRRGVSVLPMNVTT
ncbi:hypothetical protein SynBIOSE41_00997 [Synechococcus sp. BIOS-E4-1]|nr:hypothetical protein SynBIOSE41_00997 [Synechococcus sp. BIOS-E4-1]